MATKKTQPAEDDEDIPLVGAEALYSPLTAGCTVRQLELAFGKDRRDILAAVAHIKPCAVRGKMKQLKLYQIRDVAPMLVKPAVDPGDLEEQIKKMSFHDLPKSLSKEFWAGMKSRQEYMIKSGELWSTSQVVEKVGALVKLVKLSAQLTGDAVERQVDLTERQRAIIRAQMDGMLLNLHRQVVELFQTDDGRSRDHDLDLAIGAGPMAEESEDGDPL